MINGQTYDWESVSATILGRTLDGIKDISYDEEQEIEAVYGRGSRPIAYGKGKYKSSGKMTLLKSEYNELKKLVDDKGGIYKMKPFEITVVYQNDDQTSVTEILSECLIKKVGRSAKQGDKELTVSIDLEILGGISVK